MTIQIPRTDKRFYGLLVQVLTEGAVKAADTDISLMCLLGGHIEDHLPKGCPKVISNLPKIGTSTQARFVELRPFVEKLSTGNKGPVVFSIGAVSKGQPCIPKFTKVWSRTICRTA